MCVGGETVTSVGANGRSEVQRAASTCNPTACRHPAALLLPALRAAAWPSRGHRRPRSPARRLSRTASFFSSLEADGMVAGAQRQDQTGGSDRQDFNPRWRVSAQTWNEKGPTSGRAGRHGPGRRCLCLSASPAPRSPVAAQPPPFTAFAPLRGADQAPGPGERANGAHTGPAPASLHPARLTGCAPMLCSQHHGSSSHRGRLPAFFDAGKTRRVVNTEQGGMSGQQRRPAAVALPWSRATGGGRTGAHQVRARPPPLPPLPHR